MRENSVELICSIGELAGLFENYTNLNQFLQTVAEIIARHMKSAVCSIYLYDEAENMLIMRATYGLEKFAIGQVTMKPGEGITGTAFLLQKPIIEDKGSSNPHFKFFPGIMEETYEAFLAVPIMLGESPVGVIVVQDDESALFDENDSKVLKAIATQLAATIENARLLMSLNQERSPVRQQSQPARGFRKGESAAPGIALGQAFIYCSCNRKQLLSEKYTGPKLGVADFNRALQKTENQLHQLQKEVAERLSDVASLIFSAHLLILKDSGFSGKMRERILGGESPQEAILAIVDSYINLFLSHPDQRFREKVHDIKDLGQRLFYNLFEENSESSNYKGKIIIADEVLPSDILKIAAQQAAGLIMLNSAVTAHVSVLTRSLELPAVIINNQDLLELKPDTFVIIDADHGNIYIEPGPAVIEEFQKQQQTLRLLKPEDAAAGETTQTADNVKVKLLCNINLLNDIRIANLYKAEGIGLYRSEFPFIVRNDFPSEEEQYQIYGKICSAMGEREITIRTLDIGGDKMLSFYPHISESNPFLGMRAIRFSLKNKHIFATQIRAILRAGQNHNLKIMFPLVASLDDFLKAREIVLECLQALQAEQVPCCTDPSLGVMVELPSAVTLIRELAAAADFLSIGSNDLVQYLLAVDRTNQHIAELYQPHHPAVLRTLRIIVAAAARAGKPVSLCGDIAADEKLLPFLIGIGLRCLSVDPRLLPAVQRSIAGINTGAAEKLARRVVRLGRISEVEKILFGKV